MQSEEVSYSGMASLLIIQMANEKGVQGAARNFGKKNASYFAEQYSTVQYIQVIVLQIHSPFLSSKSRAMSGTTS